MKKAISEFIPAMNWVSFFGCYVHILYVDINVCVHVWQADSRRESIFSGSTKYLSGYLQVWYPIACLHDYITNVWLYKHINTLQHWTMAIDNAHLYIYIYID